MFSIPDARRKRESGFVFATLRLEPDGTLLRGEESIHLPPRELSALRLLLEHAGEIVSPAQLKSALWGEVHVTGDSVPRCISSLRARLEPDDCIQTVYKRGYRMRVPVELRAARPGERSSEATVPSLPRLAILPFACGPNVARHLGSAVAEETAARLTVMHPQSVTVLARDSVFSLADRGMSAQQVGEALQADLAVTGKLHALPSHFRLRVEMLRVRDGSQIWVEDMLAGPDRVAGLETELVEQLTFRLGGGYDVSASAEDEPQLDGQAYDAWLRGRYEWQSMERHRMQDGVQILRRAAELEPRLVKAHIDLAHACLAQELFGFISPTVAAEQVRRMAETLRDTDQECAEILPAVGWLAFHVDRDLRSAQHMFAASANLEFDPWRTRMKALFAASRHRFGEVTEILESAQAIDPFSPWVNGALAWAYHLARRRQESVEQIERCLERDPEHTSTLLYGGLILAYNGEAHRASELTRALARSTPYFDLAMAVHAYALASDGRTDEARDLLERLQWLGRERYVMRSFTAAAYAAVGDAEGAMAELTAADKDRCPWFFTALADPRLDSLRETPGFEELKLQLDGMELAGADEDDPGGIFAAEVKR